MAVLSVDIAIAISNLLSDGRVAQLLAFAAELDLVVNKIPWIYAHDPSDNFYNSPGDSN